MNKYLINITNNDNCDGAGCSVLSLLPLEYNEGYPIKKVTTIAVNRNYVEHIIEILLDNIDNFPGIKFPENMEETITTITHEIPYDSKEEFLIILTFTDIPVNTKCMQLVDELVKKSRIPIIPYIIDHHETNTDPFIYMKTTSIAMTRWHPNNIIIQYNPCTLDLRECSAAGITITNFSKERLRSATLLYYKWLCDMKFIEDEAIIAIFAYEISQYDTFEFEHYYEEDMHCKNPDGYTVLFNNISSFQEWVDEIVNSFHLYSLFTMYGFRSATSLDIHDKLFIHGYDNAKVPLMISSSCENQLTTLGKHRETQYQCAKSKLRIFSDQNIVQKRRERKWWNNYIVGILFKDYTNANDMSYIGNRFCEENPDVDLVVFVDVTSLTISMRTNKDNIDLTKISSAFGGDGHPKATEFPTTVDMVTELLQIYHRTDKFVLL